MTKKIDWNKADKIIKKSKTPEDKERERKHKKEVQELLKEKHLLTENPQNLTKDPSAQERIKRLQEITKDKHYRKTDEMDALYIQAIKGLIKLGRRRLR